MRSKVFARCIHALLLVLVVAAPAAAQQTMIFVRHAERADGGAGMQPASPNSPPADPSLSAAGEARAARLAAMLADAGVKGIYTSEFKRTKETAAPLASKLGLKIEVVPSKDYAALVAKIKGAHARDTVLVVGHSNTIPEAIKAFGGPALTIADDEYTGIYIFTPSTGAIMVIRY
ncbi:MAG TPA: phosphoglycerate mutase family protein [Vicinamibacterales bacterium]|nr:phosphoglycerate mutase family protein [Vicinamibacterales bacterium]